jgi:uncharacterized protein YndB with AHSA1/START domain
VRTARGRGEIAAEREIGQPPEDVFAFLTDLENHWLIADRFVDVVELEGPPGARHGGRVRIRGPLGIRRTATTRVLTALPTTAMQGGAWIGALTHARVKWRLEPGGAGTRVALHATVQDASALDRLLLALGGRRWMQRRFESTLERLAERGTRPPAG